MLIFSDSTLGSRHTHLFMHIISMLFRSHFTPYINFSNINQNKYYYIFFFFPLFVHHMDMDVNLDDLFELRLNAFNVRGKNEIYLEMDFTAHQTEMYM